MDDAAEALVEAGLWQGTSWHCLGKIGREAEVLSCNDYPLDGKLLGSLDSPLPAANDCSLLAERWYEHIFRQQV